MNVWEQLEDVKVGESIKCLSSNTDWFTNGRQYKVYGDDKYKFIIDDEGDSCDIYHLDSLMSDIEVYTAPTITVTEQELRDLIYQTMNYNAYEIAQDIFEEVERRVKVQDGDE